MTPNKKNIMVIILGLLFFLKPVAAQSPITITLFIDEETLTIYVSGNQSVSLEGLGFEVVIGSEYQDFYLSDYGAFQLYLPNVPAPTCFRLERDNSSRSLPQICPDDQTTIQKIAYSDVFWYNDLANQFRAVSVIDSGSLLGVCPASLLRCDLTYDPPTLSETIQIPQPTINLPTSTPKPTEISLLDTFELAEIGVQNNAQWIPHIESFDEVEMVLVPSGCFIMGIDNEENNQIAHEVCIDKSFWLDLYEVTNTQYGDSTCSSDWEQPKRCISWFDAKAHCEARGGRLPSEAEWEYAARGPDNLIYPWGNSPFFTGTSEIIYPAVYGVEWPSPVGSEPYGISWVGAFDMSGNAWEWVSTIFDENKYPFPYDNTDGRENLENDTFPRIIRGGGFASQDFPDSALARFYADPSQENAIDVGFRCAIDYE